MRCISVENSSRSRTPLASVSANRKADLAVSITSARLAWSVSEAASISGGGALRCSNANREGASAALQPSAAAPSSMASGMSFAAAVQGCVLPKICSCAPLATPRCRQPDKSKAPFQSRAARVENGLHPLHTERFPPSWKRQVHARMRPPTRPAAATTWAEKGGGRGSETALANIMPLCFAMCLVCSTTTAPAHGPHGVTRARCGLRGFAPGRLAGISPAVMAAVVAAHHLLDLLEQRLGRRLHAARVRLHPPHRVARRDEEGAERRPAEAAARRGLRCLDH